MEYIEELQDTLEHMEHNHGEFVFAEDYIEEDTLVL